VSTHYLQIKRVRTAVSRYTKINTSPFRIYAVNIHMT